jgi:hypothetical protein
VTPGPPPGVTHRRDHQPTCIVRWYANHPIGATAKRINGSTRTQNPSTTMRLTSLVGSSNHLDSNKNKHHSRSATIPIHTRSAADIAKIRHAHPPWPFVFICSTGPGSDSLGARPATPQGPCPQRTMIATVYAGQAGKRPLRRKATEPSKSRLWGCAAPAGPGRSPNQLPRRVGGARRAMPHLVRPPPNLSFVPLPGFRRLLGKFDPSLRRFQQKRLVVRIDGILHQPQAFNRLSAALFASTQDVESPRRRRL